MARAPLAIGSGSGDDLAGDVIAQFEVLEGDRTTWLMHWQRVANYILPNRNDYIVDKTPGQRRMQWIYDSTPVFANEMFAAGVHSLLTSPTLQWFYLRTDDDRLNTSGRVQAWLDDTARRMYGIYNGSRHNFASQSNELYLDIGSIGTGVMAQLESARSGILFSTRHLKECVIAVNEEDRVDTLIRRWTYTAKQAWQAWGPAAGEAVVKALDKTPDKPMTFLHAARPRRQRDPQRADARNMPFQSVYVSLDGKHVIAEGGFQEFPYHVPRFSKVSGETYGRGPGMTMLPDVQMLNEMVRTVLKSAQKVVDPPLMLPDDGFLVPVKTSPGSLNFYRAGTRDRIEPIQTEGQVQLGAEMLQALRQQIMRGWYVEWMNMPSDPSDPAAAGKGVTATYVLQQRDEKMRLLSPLLARLQAEFLGPLIDRTFGIMWRQSMRERFGPAAMLSPPPPELSGRALRTEYVSPLAIAQRSSQLDTLARLVQAALGLAQVDPTAPGRIDAQAILELTSRDLNAPAVALKPREQFEQEQQQRKQAEAEMNAHAQAATQAKALRDGAGGVKALAQAQAAGQPAQAAA